MDFPIPKIKLRKFCIDNDSEREECEKILSKYDPLGRIMRQTEAFDKEGAFYVHLQWLEDPDSGDFRE